MENKPYLQFMLLLCHSEVLIVDLYWLNVGAAPSGGGWAEKQRVMGSSPGVDKNLRGLLVAGGSNGTPSEHCQGTLKQSTYP